MIIFAAVTALFLEANPIQIQVQEVEIEGQVSSVSGNTIVLFDGRVVVEAPGVPEAGQLEAGMGVSIEAVVDGGRIIAREIETENNPESSVEGIVTEVDSNRGFITVGTIPIALDSNTDFEDVEPTSIEAGMEVEVEVRLEAGRIVATEVEAD